jgi:hypothetical protein
MLAIVLDTVFKRSFCERMYASTLALLGTCAFFLSPHCSIKMTTIIPHDNAKWIRALRGGGGSRIRFHIKRTPLAPHTRHAQH